MKFCILFKLSPCPRYCLLIGSQLTTWSQGNLHYIRLHFFQLNREFFCLLPSLARLYSAAASPSERLSSDGSLAIKKENFKWLSQFLVNPVQSTPDNSNRQGKSKKVRVIGSSKQITGSKGKTSCYCTVNILITFNCRNVKLKWNDASRI